MLSPPAVNPALAEHTDNLNNDDTDFHHCFKCGQQTTKPGAGLRKPSLSVENEFKDTSH